MFVKRLRAFLADDDEDEDREEDREEEDDEEEDDEEEKAGACDDNDNVLGKQLSLGALPPVDFLAVCFVRAIFSRSSLALN